LQKGDSAIANMRLVVHAEQQASDFLDVMTIT